MYSFPKNIKITSSDKFYFTCPSYGFISPVLSLIDDVIAHNPEITIIVMDEHMRSFWDSLVKNKNLDWNILFLNTNPPGRYRDVLSWFKIGSTIQKLYEEHFRSIESAYFYCCGHASDLILFSLVRLIAKQNTVAFLNILYPGARRCYSLKALILLVHTWIFYRLNVVIKRFDYKEIPFIFLSERYFKKLNIQLHEFKYHYSARLFQKYNPIPDHYTSGRKIVWLDDDCSLYGSEMQDQAFNCFKELKSIIDKNFTKKEILLKSHPNPLFHAEKLVPIYRDYEELPSFMNADFVIPKPGIRFIMGGNSAVLSTAAMHTDIIAISYLKLMPFQDQNTKNNVINFLMELGDQKILFVDSLEELDLLFKTEKRV